ncbi:tryptophan synthase subunit beta [Marinilabiliaceae bacterium ANBcel2]|nr:tryptophan synthase subunit beta [Marinilabiliaceae bacterium ANBcel2]
MIYPDSKGFYGEFGGAFIPEMLLPNIERLKSCYNEILSSDGYKQKLSSLLNDYAGRPTPLYEASNLSSFYNTNVWLKREDLNHTGSHKINNTIGQILLAKELGRTRIIAETGAGQHGVATATVAALMNMECVVYMGEVDIERQAPNVARMKMLGAEVRPAVSGSRTLKDATNEALRDWINNPTDTFYIIGSVVGPHPYPDIVTRLQSVIGIEIEEHFRLKTGKDYPDYVLSCVGGGSNAAGSFFPFINNDNVTLLGAEAAGLGEKSGKTAASMACGDKGVIHGSFTYLMQNDDGQITEPYSLSAGLDYPGVGPLHSFLKVSNRAQYIPVSDKEALDAALQLTRLEGIVPALESAHALALLNKREFLHGENVVITVSGRGDKDMQTYMREFNL